ncbi:MAG: PAS domain-containing protein, partial [Rhizobiales bacterium]|nr:PAS domain-containing protein [Rhizobacter sp.]
MPGAPPRRHPSAMAVDPPEQADEPREDPERDGALAGRSPQAQAALFKLLADNVPVLIAYYDAQDFRCRFANREYAQTFGRDERTIVGSTFEEVIGVEAAREIQPQVERM